MESYVKAIYKEMASSVNSNSNSKKILSIMGSRLLKVENSTLNKGIFLKRLVFVAILVLPNGGKVMYLETTTLTKKNQGTFTKKVRDILNIKQGDKIDFIEEKGQIIIAKHIEVPQTAQKLFAGWQDDGIRSGELDWDDAQGTELQW
ncbi:MAG: type II toxin-antitoxin system PrlF family antitoxin [Streptococcaceae bacterium]|jgi:bifunctional DNA-binding transcriptional regulator/antitoxin component of YhaV-PrlF toxin-antitoxin module|nr:type II toxin-antitoxin system PrlF family antitoxin [Streptococcaceae bacterium]